MIPIEIKTAFRDITKNPLTAAINILGLSLGFASVFIILLFIRYELSYDKFHEHKDDIYRIAWFSQNPQTRTPHPMAQGMVMDFPEVESAVSLSPIWGPGLTRRVFSIMNPQNKVRFDEKNILAVDSTFFDVFSFNLVRGNPKTVLRNVGGILISEEMANKYFSGEDPVGRQLSVNNNEFLAEVEGVFEKVPENAHFRFDFLVSYVTLKAVSDKNSEYYTWKDFGHFNYIRLNPRAAPKLLESKLMEWAAPFIGLNDEDLRKLKNSQESFKLQPLTSIHLKSNIRWELEANGNIGYVYLMGIAAVFILMMACVNFMNLSIAKSLDRIKEIGIRKANGASKLQLIRQFMAESVLLAGIALLLAGLIMQVSIPLINGWLGKQLVLNFIEEPDLLCYFFLIFLFTGLIPGLYPALYLSSVSLPSILRGSFKASPKGRLISQSLVVVQFAIALVLISGSVIIFNQLRYFQHKALGFQKEHVLEVPIKSEAVRARFSALKTELLAIDGVHQASACSNVPGKQFNQNTTYPVNDPQNRIDISEWMVDEDVIETLNLQMISGRSFSLDYATDSLTAFIINQKAVNSLDLNDPVGKLLTWEKDDIKIKGRIVGVLKDFHFQSLHQPVRPVLVAMRRDYNHALLKIGHDNTGKVIEEIRQVWEAFDRQHEFEYAFLDETINEQYRAESSLGQAVNGFAVLAVMLACLGLFGVAKLSFAKKIRQIGIRKVMGAASTGLIVLLVKDYSRLVVIAISAGIPVSWLVMKSWLQNFEYRIAINPMVFLATGLSLLLITWLALAYLTYKTVKVNPVETLKDD